MAIEAICIFGKFLPRGLNDLSFSISFPYLWVNLSTTPPPPLSMVMKSNEEKETNKLIGFKKIIHESYIVLLSCQHNLSPSILKIGYLY